MNSEFWQLSGPRRFVRRVVDDLREGKNVVVCLPEHIPARFSTELRNVLYENFDSVLQVLRLASSDLAPPATFLGKHILQDLPPASILSAATLVSDEAFSGRFLWLDGLTAETWPAWQAFLTEYSHVCRSVSVMDRTLLCISLTGELTDLCPPVDVCLACHQWRGVVDSVDALSFSSQLLRDHPVSMLQKRVLCSTCAHLALWDPCVAVRLVAAGTGAFFDPYPVLQAIADERGWFGGTSADSPTRWSQGQIDLFDGRELVHSAALAHHDPNREIIRRIWSAQVGVLFPYVEQQRQVILGQLRGVLQVPFITRFGASITDWRDLEIGHIESQIATNQIAISDETRLRLRDLRRIRNCLAHQEVVPHDLLTDSQFAIQEPVPHVVP
jgi:hypothetical protein